MEAACQPARKTPGRLTPAGNDGVAAPASLPARLSGQKVVYGCMPGTGVTFRDTVTVSGCFLFAPTSAPGCLAASGRRPDYDRQLLTHPPVSAEPAGAVSGCRYGPMRENTGLQRPFRSRRPCRAVACAPGIPAKRRRDVRRNAVSRTRSPSLRRVPAHCLPGATHPYESLSPGA